LGFNVIYTPAKIFKSALWAKPVSFAKANRISSIEETSSSIFTRVGVTMGRKFTPITAPISSAIAHPVQVN